MDEGNTFGGVNLNDYVPPTYIGAEDGEINEAEIRIIDAQGKEGISEKTGKKWALINFTLVEEGDSENPKPFYHSIFKSQPGDKAWQKNASLGKIKDICDAFSYFPSTGEPMGEEMVGLVGRAKVRYVNGDASSTPYNEIVSFIKG